MGVDLNFGETRPSPRFFFRRSRPAPPSSKVGLFFVITSLLVQGHRESLSFYIPINSATMAPDSGSKKKRPTIIDLSQDDDDDDDDDRPNLFPTSSSTKKRRKTKSPPNNSKVKVEGVKNVVVLDVDGVKDEEVQVVEGGGGGVAISTISTLQQNKATAGKSNGDDDEVAVVGTKNSVRLPHVSVCMWNLCCLFRLRVWQRSELDQATPVVRFG